MTARLSSQPRMVARETRARRVCVHETKGLTGLRDAWRVHPDETVVGYTRMSEITLAAERASRPAEILGVEIGTRREAIEIIGGIVFVLALWFGTPWVLDIAKAAL